MNSYFALFSYVIHLLVVGLPLVYLLLPRDRKHPAELWLPLSFAMGWGVHGLLVILTQLFLRHSPPDVLSYAAFAGTGLILVLFLATDPRNVLTGFRIARFPRRGTLLYGSLLFLVLARVFLLLEDATRFPLYTWDARFIWNMKAILLFNEGSVFADAFLDPARIHFHRDYPLLLPTAYLGIYNFAGAVEERMARLFLAVMMCFFGLAMFDAVRRRATPMIALLFTLVLLAGAFRQDYGSFDGITLTSGVADFPLAFLAFLAFAAYLRGWQEGHWRWFVLGGILTGFCFLVKMEGLVVFALAALMNAVGVVVHRRGAPWRRAAARPALALGLALVVALPWFVLKAGLPNFYDESYGDTLRIGSLGAVLARFPIVAQYYYEHLFRFANWGFTWSVYLALLPATAYCWRRGRRYLLDIVIVGWLAAYFVVYMLSPLYLGYHIETSIGRLFSHIMPLALLQVATLGGLWLRSGAVGKDRAPAPGPAEPAREVEALDSPDMLSAGALVRDGEDDGRG